jgi:pimeloyl-ACP methyl ester carboxylesterase
MFSRLATPHSYQHFEQHVFPGIKAAVRARNNRGFREHLKVLEIADPRAYYDYSAQLVADSDSNTLIERFLALPTPRHFVYGDANRGLPYLPRLRAGQCTVVELADADHFMFYDDPAAFAECVARAAGP